MDQHKNFSRTAVAVAPSPATSGTTLTVTTGHGTTRFPTVPFNLTISPTYQIADAANTEIVRCTAIVGDVLTIVRAQEGSTARTVVVGDVVTGAITKLWFDDLEAALALNAPINSPTFTGTVVIPSGATLGGVAFSADPLTQYVKWSGRPGGQILTGGTAATDGWQLKASSSILATGTIDMVGASGSITFRHKASTGNLALGTDVVSGTFAVAANCKVFIGNRDPSVAHVTWPVPIGTGLHVSGSTADVARMGSSPNANGSNIHSIYDVDQGTGGNAIQHVSLLGIARNFDTLFRGATVAFQGYGYANTNVSTGLHADASLPFGMDCKARVADTVTDASHPAISGLEVGGADDSLHRQANVGSGVRLTNQGSNDVRQALLISNTPGRFGAWQHGIVIATGTFSVSENWVSGHAYTGGEVASDTINGGFFICKFAVTSTTRPGGVGGDSDTTGAPDATKHWRSLASASAAPAWVTGWDHGVHSVVNASGADWICAVAHGPSYGTASTTNPTSDRWNGYNGTAGPDGLASVTASAGHWNVWENTKGVTPSWVNTSLTASTKSVGYYHWVGQVLGSDMNANVPTGTTTQKFSLDTDGNMVVDGKITGRGNIGFNGKTAQATTGWAAPTATLSRAALANGASATTVLQTVAALITDLRANGVIG